MSEVSRLLALWQRATARGDRLCMATVVHTEGSSYRKVGARMLLSSSGERAGAISGGCLEIEVGQRAWWLAAEGAHLERYSSFVDEDGQIPYGVGCGGAVSVLLETGAAVEAVLKALEHGQRDGRAAIIVHALGAPPSDRNSAAAPGTIGVLLSLEPEPGAELHLLYSNCRARPAGLLHAARAAYAEQRSLFLDRRLRRIVDSAPREPGDAPAFCVEYLAAPPALTIYGAGDDARPLAEFAYALGWRVNVADGRSDLARPERFPTAAAVHVLRYPDNVGLNSPQSSDEMTHAWLPPTELAVLLTHSYEQDRALLLALLPQRLRYLGILGPRHRTERLLAELCPSLGMTLEEGLARLHSPVGLDLGSVEAAAIALSIVAEIQAVLNDRRVTIERGGPLPADRV